MRIMIDEVAQIPTIPSDKLSHLPSVPVPMTMSPLHTT